MANGYNVREETLQDGTSGAVRPPLLASLGAVPFGLLIACANVANLMLTRAAARSKESAARIAMGANRRQLAGSAQAESFVLAVLGGGLGLALGHYGLPLMKLQLAASIRHLAGRGDELDVSALRGLFAGRPRVADRPDNRIAP